MARLADGSGQVGVFQTLRETPLAARFVLLGVFINQFGAFLQFFLVLYLTARGYSDERAAIGLGAYSAGAILGTLFGGVLSDRLGPRWTIVASMACAALFTLSVTALHSYPAIIVAVALSGSMTQASRPAVSSLLFGYVSEARQVMMFAMYRTALNTGMVAGPLVATWLSTISWNLVFYFDAATSLAYCAIAIFLLPDDEVTASAAGEPAEEPDATDGRRAGYLTVLRDRRYLAYLSLMLANGLVFVQFVAVLPLMLKAEGYPAWAYGTTASVAAFIVVGCELLVTRTTQAWPAWVAVIAGWVLMAISRGGYGLPGGLTIVIIATGLATIGQIIGGPAAFAYPAKVAPAGAVGRYIGSAHAMFGLGSAVGPVVGVLLWSHLGKTFWALCFAFGVVMVVPGIWGMRPVGAAADRADRGGPAESESPAGDPAVPGDPPAAGKPPLGVDPATEGDTAVSREVGAVPDAPPLPTADADRATPAVPQPTERATQTPISAAPAG